MLNHGVLALEPYGLYQLHFDPGSYSALKNKIAILSIALGNNNDFMIHS